MQFALFMMICLSELWSVFVNQAILARETCNAIGLNSHWKLDAPLMMSVLQLKPVKTELVLTHVSLIILAAPWQLAAFKATKQLADVPLA